MFTRKLLTLLALFIAGTSTANATFHRWEISELYSNADGTIQFIELFENRGKDDQNLLFTDAAAISNGVDPEYLFASDLPSILTADKYFILGTNDYAAVTSAPAPDYIIPDGFLLTGGGTLSFGDTGILDVSIVTYGSLLIDSFTSLHFAGDASSATDTHYSGPFKSSPTNFAGVTGVVPVPAAVWLFGSGLIGLVGVARRKARV